jgi:hypothetical protein
MGTVPSRVAENIGVLKSLFIQRPEVHLTVAEMCHLADLEPARCEALLDVLVKTGFLTRGFDGCLRCRSDSESGPHHRETRGCRIRHQPQPRRSSTAMGSHDTER